MLVLSLSASTTRRQRKGHPAAELARASDGRECAVCASVSDVVQKDSDRV